jgi:hypothetical protein
MKQCNPLSQQTQTVNQALIKRLKKRIKVCKCKLNDITISVKEQKNPIKL